MIEGHTLVIPTYNRPELLRRLVRYYCTRAGRANLLVLDSSTPKVAEQNANALSAYGESVRHVVFPGTAPMAFKLSRGLPLVQTSYASFCGDDDFVFPGGLREAVAFLEGHPDHVCAHGLYLNFRQEGHDVHLIREYAGPGNDARHPGARIFRLFQKYESLFYAAFRTSDLRDIFSAVAALPTLHYQELFQSVAALIKGKVQRFPRLYAARQSCSPAEPERDKWQTYYWFADNPAEVLDHYRSYRDEVWKFYEAHGSTPRLDKDAFVRALDLAHAVYFSAACPPEYFHSVLQPYWPEDPYLEVADVDLFDRLRSPGRASSREAGEATPRGRPGTPAGPQKWSAAWARAALRFAPSAALAAPRLARLNHQVQRTCRSPWKCRLPVRLRWLAGVEDFRKFYFELCRYLDQA